MVGRPKFIALCTPSRTGFVSIDWAGSLRSLAWPRNVNYINFLTVDSMGGQVAETRNQCVQLVLAADGPEREITHIFWLDDDVFPSRLVVPRLFSHDKDIVSGVYFTKSDISEPVVFPGMSQGVTPFVPDQFFEGWGHGLGLCLVKTDVYRKMVKDGAIGFDRFLNHAWHRSLGAEEAGIDSSGTLHSEVSEDIYFLEKAREVGFTTWIDTSGLAFGWHIDPVKKIGYPKPQYAQLLAGESIVWDTPSGQFLWPQR